VTFAVEEQPLLDLVSVAEQVWHAAILRPAVSDVSSLGTWV
jgi:hypothetical protein